MNMKRGITTFKISQDEEQQLFFKVHAFIRDSIEFGLIKTIIGEFDSIVLISNELPFYEFTFIARRHPYRMNYAIAFLLEFSDFLNERFEFS